MSTLAVASAGTSPGVTTTALALTMAWARPVMLVEADVSKPSAVVAGLLQGALPADAGLMGVAQTAGIEAVTEQDIWDFSVPLPQQSDEELGRWLLPALSEPAAARQMRSFWTDLLRVLRGLDAHPMDAIVDLGRIEERHGRHDLILDTDHLALVVRSDLASVAALGAYLPEIEADRASRGASETISVIVVEDLAQKISSSQISKYLGVPVAGRIPHAAQAAAALSGGARVTTRTRRPLEAAARAATATLVQSINNRRALMEGPVA